MLAIFLDMETTGLDPRQHFAIDIALKIVDLSTFEIKATYQSIVKQPRENWLNHDPVSVQINGYTWESLQQGKEPFLVSKEIIDLFDSFGIERGTSVFICQNPAFDRGFFTQLVDVYTQERLNWPYHWLDLASMYWAKVVQRSHERGVPFPVRMNLSKNQIAKEFGLQPEADRHEALNGVDHLIKCYRAVLGA